MDTPDRDPAIVAPVLISFALREKWGKGVRSEIIRLQDLIGCELLESAVVNADRKADCPAPFRGYVYDIYYEFCSAEAQRLEDPLTIHWDRRWNFRDENGLPRGAVIVAIPANAAANLLIAHFFWEGSSAEEYHLPLSPEQLRRMLDQRLVPRPVYEEAEKSLWED